MTDAEIAEALRLHRAFVFGEENGRIADFSSKEIEGKDFSGELLMWAILKEATFKNCIFEYASMDYLDASGAKFENCNLKYASFNKASLSGASFNDSDLNGVVGNGKQIITMSLERWPVAYTETHLQIGCERHLIEDWWKFTDKQIDAMSKHALAWWKNWKPILQKAIENNPAKAA